VEENVSDDARWNGLKQFIDEHQALLLDYNVSTEEMRFEDGEIVFDDIRYRLSDQGWRSLCSRMKKNAGGKKPPSDYIRYLPMELQEQVMMHHFKECPNKRHFMRCKASDNGPFIRAFLSETYQRGRFDYADFVDLVFDDFREKMPGFVPASYSVGETIFQLKAMSDAVIPDPVKADLRVGILFSDSEVGCGTVVIRPFARRMNSGHDMFILQDAFRRRHSGPRRYRDKKGNLVMLNTETLKNGVSTDKLRISKDIKAHIEQLVEDHQTQIEEAKKLVFAYYDTALPIEGWGDDEKEQLSEWIWKRSPLASVLGKKYLKDAVDKTEEYDMPNVWGLFNALCEMAENVDKEKQLDNEVTASRLASHLYSILK